MPKLIKRKPIADDPWSIDPDTLLFSDLHLYDRPEFKRLDPATGLNVRLQEGLNVLDQICTIVAENDKKLSTVMCLGDAFEQKDRIPTHVLLNFRYALEKMLGVTIHYTHLMGNHDFNLLEYPTMEIFDSFDNFWFIKEPIHKHWNPGFACIPYQRDPKEFQRIWDEFYDDPEIRIVLMHQLVAGVKYETGKLVTEGLKLRTHHDVLYLSGDAHMPQFVNGIQYLGSPYQIRFSDEGQPRYIWLMNSETLELRPLELSCSKFISVDVHSFIEPEKVDNNYIRIAGEVEPGEFDTKARNSIRELLEKEGAKAVVFNLKIKRQSQSKVPDSIIDDDEAVIRKYAEDNLTGGLQLDRLIKTGAETYGT